MIQNWGKEDWLLSLSAGTSHVHGCWFAMQSHQLLNWASCWRAVCKEATSCNWPLYIIPTWTKASPIEINATGLPITAWLRNYILSDKFQCFWNNNDNKTQVRNSHLILFQSPLKNIRGWHYRTVTQIDARCLQPWLKRDKGQLCCGSALPGADFLEVSDILFPCK